MQKYIKVAFEARGLDPSFDHPLCERCEEEYSQDVDHIYGRRGKRMLDPRNLIFLCRQCHMNKGGSKRKKAAELIVQNAIEKD